MKLLSVLKCAALTLPLMASTSLAHVEPGKYSGTTSQNVSCEMIAGETYFEHDQRHPLNERIKIQVDGSEYLVSHPAIVDEASGVVTFNHDVFQGVLPTSSGAKALIVHMVHTEEKEGPVSFTLIESSWRDSQSTKTTCLFH